MKKLELKHIAPYLPYGLKVLSKPHLVTYGKQIPLEVNGIAYQDTASPPDWQYEFIVNDELMFAKINEKKHFKPILNPIINLLNDDDTILEIYNNSWIAGQHKVVKSVGKISIISHEDGELNIWLNKPHCSMEWVNEILYKHHYDLKGLIEKGLAIDKNTLE